MNETFSTIKKNIKNGKIAPIYFLHGEESLYTDLLVEMFENILPENERVFNLFLLYAIEKSPDDIMDIARRYPLMSDKIIVIVKETQSAKGGAGKWINKLTKYAENPSSDTILVVVARGAKVACKEFTNAVSKNGGVVFESTKVRDSYLHSAVEGLIADVGLKYENKAVNLLTDQIGNDLSKIYNEIKKLQMILPQGATVTPEVIERNIGISRKYNNFELTKAIAERDFLKAIKIIRYFKSNQRDNPLVLTMASIFMLFSRILEAVYSDKTDSALAGIIGYRNPEAVKELRTAMNNYSASQAIEIIRMIRDTDVKTKGGGSRMDPGDLLENLILSISLATGKIN